ncbi:hypothetical protein D3C77_627030 [compost metagenome]
MRTRSAEHHDTNVVGFVDPVEDIDDLGPEGRVHRIDLLRPINYDICDFISQLDTKGLVLVHATILGSRCSKRGRRHGNSFV